MTKMICIILMQIFAASSIFAQKTVVASKPKTAVAIKPSVQNNVPVKEPPVTDTLSYNIKKTIDKLSLFVLDPDIPVESLTDSFLGNKTFGQPYYSSVIRFPGAVENTINRYKVNREAGVTEWEWTAILTRIPKGMISKETLDALSQKTDSVLNTIHYKPGNEKNKFTTMSAYYNAAYAWEKTEEVSLHVRFVKPCYQTEQQSIDSLTKLYAPGLMNFETAQDAAKKYSSTLLAENISKEKVIALLAAELKKAADKDIKTGFQFLMGASSDIKSAELSANLTPGQKEQIHNIAQAYLDAYNEQRPFDLKTFDPTPPRPQYYAYNGGTYSAPATNPNLYKKPEPEGKRVKCPICNGSGQMEVVDYAHTYEGIFSNITTSYSHWTTCTYCKGEGWVTKFKKK